MASERKSKFNISPYYDDFDEAKKFLRVLFRPSYSVQARELTQLQSILNNQIGRMGDHLFENGDVVKGAGISESKVEFIRLESTATVDPADLVNYDLTLDVTDEDGTTVTRRGRVVDFERPTATDPHIVLFYEPLTGKGNIAARADASGITQETRNSTLFIGGDALTTTNPSIDPGPTGLVVKPLVETPDSEPTATSIPDHGEALLVTVDEGIFYAEGFFVLGTKQSHAVFKTTNGIRDYRIDGLTAVVGFGIQREIVTSTGDSTLLDPAQGSYNYNAPGADRYKIDLVIKQIEFAFNELGYRTEFDAENFIEFFRVLNGETFKTLKYTEYAQLEETLARRTYDESGHYTVEMFPLDIDEYIEVFDPALSPSEDIQNNDENYFVAGLGKGKAYVKGYEFENQSTEYIVGRKARGSDHIRSQDEKLIYNNIGNYVIVQNSATNPVFGGSALGFFGSNSPTSIFGPRQMKLALHDATGVQIGCANAVQLQPDNSEKTLYRLYLSDIGFGESVGLGSAFNERSIDEVVTFRANETYDPNVPRNEEGVAGNTTLFTAEANTVTGGSQLYDAGNMNLIYPLPVGNFVKTVRGLDYYVQRDYVATLDGSAKAVFGNGNNTTLNQNPNNELVFQGVNNSDGVIDDIDALDDYIVVHEGTVYDPSSAAAGVTISAQSGNKAVEIELPAGSTGKVYLLANQRVEDSTGVISNGNYREKRLKRGRIVLSGFWGDDGTIGDRATNAVADGFGISLLISDVYQLIKVTDNTAPEGEDSDITSIFRLDNGQRSHLYDHSSIVLDRSYENGKNGPADRWKNNGQDALFTVEFLYFDHLEGESSFNTIAFPVIADSYYGHGNHADDAGLTFDGLGGFTFDYPNIPTYTDQRTGAAIRLSDAIDHRPIRAPGADTANQLQIGIPDQEHGKIFGGYTPEDGELYFSYYDHYLSRKDLILLNKDRRFRIVEGKPELDPVEPTYDQVNNLCLYHLDVPAYTEFPQDISYRPCNTQRYTMEDIGDLDKRLTEVEETTSLNASEIDSLKKSVSNLESTTEFLVALQNDDLGAGHQGSAVDSNEHNCAIGDGILQPPTSGAFINLDIASADDGVTYDKFTRNVQLTPTTRDQYTVVQTDGNISIRPNPYQKTSFGGYMEISPQGDPGFDVTRAPKVEYNENGASTAWVFNRKKNAPGVVNGFGSEPNWFANAGYATTESTQNQTTNVRFPTFDKGSAFFNTLTNSASQYNIDPFRQGSSFQQLTARGRLNAINFNDLGYTIKRRRFGGSRWKGRLRPRTIFARAKGLKPNTRYYLYIDGKPAGGPGNNLSNAYDVIDVFGRNRGKAETVRLSRVGSVVNLTPDASGNVPVILTSNSNGELFAKFVLSIGNAYYVRTDLQIRFLDVPPNQSIQNATSYTQTYYVTDPVGRRRSRRKAARGDFHNKFLPFFFGYGKYYRRLRKTDKSGKLDFLAQGGLTEVSENLDPLNQTFFVDSEKYPTGILLSSIDLWFKAKDPNTTVQISLSPIKNNVPEIDTIFEGTNASVNGSDVNTNANGVAVGDYTRFTFGTPVLLTPGEYAINVESNSSTDELWGATIGDKGLTGDGTQTNQEVLKQPYVGDLYLAQNNGVRTKDSTKSLVFRVNRAVYQTTETKSFRLACFNNDSVTGGYEVKNALDVTVNTPDANELTVISKDQKDPSEVITYTLLTDAGINPVDAVEVQPNEVNKLTKRATLVVDNSTPVLQVTLGTNDENKSPVVDLDDLSLFASRFELSDDTTGELDPTTPESTKGKCRYIGRRTLLANPGDDIHVEFDGNLPAGTDAKVYVKLLPEGKTNFDDQPYTELVKDSTSAQITTTASPGDFYRYRYVVPSGTTIPKYRVFATKILLTGDETANQIPQVRGISTQAVVKGVTGAAAGG